MHCSAYGYTSFRSFYQQNLIPVIEKTSVELITFISLARSLQVQLLVGSLDAVSYCLEVAVGKANAYLVK